MTYKQKYLNLIDIYSNLIDKYAALAEKFIELKQKILLSEEILDHKTSGNNDARLEH